MTFSGNDSGFLGTIVVSSFMITSFLIAISIFGFLWKKGSLHFGEEAANKMLEDDHDK